MSEAEVHDKLLPLDEAVGRLVPDGCRLRSCGIGLRKPMALTYELIRQRKRDLVFILSGWTEDADMLIGAGAVRRLEGSYLGLEAFGLAHAYRRSVEKGVPHRVEIEPDVRETVPPTDEELRVLREECDPEGIFLGGPD